MFFIMADSSLQNLYVIVSIGGFCFAVYTSLRFILYSIQFMRTFVLSRLFGWHLRVETLGKWAVVTGATSGIGKAYAEQLAEKGMSIVLVSRNEDKLRLGASDIESRFSVPTRIITIDLGKDDDDAYSRAAIELDQLDIGVLVNNAGIAYTGMLLEAPQPSMLFRNIINCNAKALTMMTSLVLPGMLTRRRGAIINIGSGTGYRPTPGLSVYAATKRYVDVFTRSLQTEYRSSGLHFQVLFPFMVSSNMSKREPSFFLPSSPDFVRSALATLGNQSRSVGCVLHEVMRLITISVPEAYYGRKILQIFVNKKPLHTGEEDK